MTFKRNVECPAARGLRDSAYSGHTHVLSVGPVAWRPTRVAEDIKVRRERDWRRL